MSRVTQSLPASLVKMIWRSQTRGLQPRRRVCESFLLNWLETQAYYIEEKLTGSSLVGFSGIGERYCFLLPHLLCSTQTRLTFKAVQAV